MSVPIPQTIAEAIVFLELLGVEVGETPNFGVYEVWGYNCTGYDESSFNICTEDELLSEVQALLRGDFDE